jgi:chromosome segregation protein
VQFQRLRLSGFKSFIEPIEFRIEPGLTGVVGPNGCGKSNLLEALRWVMGANSAKAMRAGGMDDVIFSGSGARPSRNHAEVSLTIDNAERDAPSKYANEPVIEVVRRIDRGSGSTFRINGREVRARDVQLLFADASTGANSPALVRQGQISELIAAKPQNRRMILEEAGGVSGLHGRRHEAELRLRAAEVNIGRLDDVARELEAILARLKREARQAERYKRLAAEIRALHGAVHYARWSEASQGLERAAAEAEEAALAVAATAQEAAAALAASLAAEEAVGPLRDEAQAAGAILHRLAIESDRLEQEVQRAAAEVERLTADLGRLASDRARETQTLEDSQAALARLSDELADLERQIDAAPERLPQLEQAWRGADAARRTAEDELEALAAQAAAADAERRALESRVADANARLSRTQRALETAKADRAALGPQADPQAAQITSRADAAQTALRQARAALAEAEAAHAAAAAAEAEARDAHRGLQDQLAELKTEAGGLSRLAAPRTGTAYPSALDQVSLDAGYEAALAAALGDDLNAALDARAPSYWAGAGVERPPEWPAGARPLAPLIRAPTQLAARLAFTALVEPGDGDRLQAQIAPGCRLVSRQGDLWRWDGFVARADAPRPAAIRLAQRARLAELEVQVAELAPRGAAAEAAHEQAILRLRAAEEALREARKAPEAAEQALAAAREEIEQRGRDQARRDARAQSLDEMIARFEADRQEADAALEAAREEALGMEAAEDLAPRLAEARAAAGAAREADSAARAAMDGEIRDRAGRDARLAKLRDDHADWTRRIQTASSRLEALAGQRTLAEAALAQAREAPATLAGRRETLFEELAAADARQSKAAETLDAAEAGRIAADRASRAADAAASESRELRAATTARLDAGRERLAEITAALREATRMEPRALGEQLGADAISSRADAAAIELKLAHLERDRDAIGPVNLRAEEEAAEYDTRLKEMNSERADLAGAIAKLRQGIEQLNSEGRERLLAAFDVINGHFQTLFQTLFGGGQAELRLVESEDPLEAGLEIYACPPGKRLATMSLMSGGEQALTASALIFGVFLANPAPICVLDEVDAPLDDANVERFCNMLNEMRNRTGTRFIAITHNPVTMARMDRLYGVTMPERGVSQLVSVDLRQAEAMAAQ